MTDFDPEFLRRPPPGPVDHCILLGAVACILLVLLSKAGVISLQAFTPILVGACSFLAGIVFIGFLRIASIDGNRFARGLLNPEKRRRK